MHLQEIAAQFTAGEFDQPLQTHGELPDGVTEMIKRRAQTSFTCESLPGGGAVRIAAADRKSAP